MAGMLPGACVAARKSRDSLSNRCETPLTATGVPREPLITCFGGGDDDNLAENALRARRRLQQKLGYLQDPSSRSGEIPTNESRGSGQKGGGLGSKLLGRRGGRSRWHFTLTMRSKTKTCTNICSVCLEDFGDQMRPVTRLSCSHKYHSACVIPWLAANPHCPNCRRPAAVLPSSC